MVRAFPLNRTLSQGNKAKMKEDTLMTTSPPNSTSGMGFKIQHLSQLIVVGSQGRQVRQEHPLDTYA
jgi:hypothetical protein